MKKILIVVCAIMLCCCMLIPVSAANNYVLNVDGHEFILEFRLSNGGIYDTDQLLDNKEHVLLWYNSNGGRYEVISFDSFEISNDNKIHVTGIGAHYIDYEHYWLVDGETELNLPLDYVKWSMNDIYNNGQLIIEKGASPVAFCDGTACPATDSNFDNICDDCGNVLTMSLRNTLYDYALWLAESKVADGYNYYAIFKSSDTYYVHISKAPMSSPDGTVLEGDGIMYNRVTQSADGTNGGSGWYNGFYNSYDEFVEANHTISNFKGALPLAVKILGVAGEQITLKLPNLVGILMILTACGVGCLALLVVLKLFGKRSLISRK